MWDTLYIERSRGESTGGSRQLLSYTIRRYLLLPNICTPKSRATHRGHADPLI